MVKPALPPVALPQLAAGESRYFLRLAEEYARESLVQQVGPTREGHAD